MPRTFDGRHVANASLDHGLDYDNPDHPMYNYSRTGDLDAIRNSDSQEHPCTGAEHVDVVPQACIDWYKDFYGDYNETEQPTGWGEIVPVGMVYGLTLILGVVGNTLVIVAIARNRRMQTVTNAFLTSLASADLLLVLLCVPVKVGIHVCVHVCVHDYILYTKQGNKQCNLTHP